MRFLDLKPGKVAIDGTMGSGGHSMEILKEVGPQGKLIGLDQDPDALARCEEQFRNYPNVSLHHENFENIDRVLDAIKIDKVDAVLLDVGFSSDQVETSERGFSFERPGPLDMRMDPRMSVTAADLISHLSEGELVDIFRNWGGEPRARLFARAIVRSRQTARIQTTDSLVRVLFGAMGIKAGKSLERPGWARRHPATRVFQALRIAVNRELEVLALGLERFWRRLAKGGRLVVISFHSLEDRIVKNQFREWVKAGEALALTKKPVVAGAQEMDMNPRARSAKLRAVEKAA